MATQLWFRAANGSPGIHRGDNTTKLSTAAVGWRPELLATTRGSNLTGVVAASVLGPTNGVEPDDGASAYYEWYTLPLAANVTISGTITLNLWAAESDMNANMAVNAIVERVDKTGAIISTIVKTARVTEVAVSASIGSVNNFTATPTSTAMLKGERIRVRLFFDDVGTMAAGFSAFVKVGSATASVDGDSWIQFNETFSFQTTEPTGSILYLTDTAGPAVGAATEYEMWTSRGAGVNNGSVSGVAGWTAPIQMQIAGGAFPAIEWYSKQVAAFTLSGLVRINLWAQENSTASNMGIRVELAVVNNDGSGAVVFGANNLIDTPTPGGNAGSGGTDPVGEVSNLQFVTRAWITGADISVTAGQRLRLRAFIDDPSSVPMNGGTENFFYGATSGGINGDTWIQLDQTVTLSGPATVTATISTNWGTATATATAVRTTAATISTSWGTASLTATAIVTRSATGIQSWGNWTASATGTVTRVALTVAAFQFFEDDADPNTSSPTVAQNTSLAIADTTKNLLIRCLVQNTDSRSFSFPDDRLWLQISINGGAYANLASSGRIKIASSAFIPIEVDLTASRLTGGSGSFITGLAVENINVVFSSNNLTAGNYSEYAWMLAYDATVGAVGDTIDFRIARGANGSQVDTNNFTFAYTPRIIVATIVSGTITSSWGNWTATATGTVSAPVADWPATIASSWGNWAATGTATVEHPATITTSWGGSAATEHIWDPLDPAGTSTELIELGTWFNTTAPITVYGARIWGSGDTIVNDRYIKLWDRNASGASLALKQISDTLPDGGYQEFSFNTPVVLAAGQYAISANFVIYKYRNFGVNADVVNGVVTIPQGGGRYNATRGAFPDQLFQDTYYYVDLIFAEGAQTWTATATATVAHAATVTSSWGNWTATATAVRTTAATITTSWGVWTATATAVRTTAATITQSWGNWTATATAAPDHVATIATSWGNWTATATGTVTTGVTNVAATISSSWGNWTATAAATPVHVATITTNWGTWTATAAVSPEHIATISSAWGTWTATATATVNHVATITTSWGVWTATATAVRTTTATIASSWGTWTATALASAIEHPATISSSWGVWSATASASVNHPASITTSWGVWTATATATRTTPATIATTWPTWTAMASAPVLEHPAAISSSWGTWTATALASAITHPASIATNWGIWTATGLATRITSAAGVENWGGWVATAIGDLLGQKSGVINSNWSGWSATASATVNHPATITQSWGNWSATAIGTTSGVVSGTIASAWGTWSATASATVERAASITTNWGSWSATAVGTVQALILGTISSSWGTWSATATGVASGVVSGSISTTWDTWTALATGTVVHGATSSTTWTLDWTATATGTVTEAGEIPGFISTTWDNWNATAIGTIVAILHPIGSWDDQEFIEMRWEDQAVAEWMMVP